MHFCSCALTEPEQKRSCRDLLGGDVDNALPLNGRVAHISTGVATGAIVMFDLVKRNSRMILQIQYESGHRRT